METLSIVIPTYNEKNNILKILQKVQDVKLINGINKEIIIVDDFSTDGTRDVYKEITDNNIKIILQDKNQGKGSALHTGFKEATGDLIVIQDADLEYDPNDYNLMLEKIINEGYEVVYGSRFLNKDNLQNFLFKSLIANKFLTHLSRIFTGLNVTDMETCYKMFKAEILKNIELKEKKFGFEPEITAKISKLKNLKFTEVAISYNGRKYDEGKKIKFSDAINAVISIIKYKFSN